MFLWILLPILFSFFIYVIFVRPYRIWKNLAIPHTDFILYNLKVIDFFRGRKNIALVYDDVYKSFPHDPYVGIYEIAKPVLLIRDPELVNIILIKDFDYFQNRGMLPPNEDTNSLDAHLLHLCGHRWRNTRTKVMTLFSPGKLKRMFTFVRDCVDDLEEHMESYAATRQTADIKDTMLKYTTDLMGRYAFGLKLNILKYAGSEYRKFNEDSSSFSIRRIGNVLLRWIHPKLLQWLPLGITSSVSEQFFFKLLRDAVDNKDVNSDTNFLKLLSNIQNQERQKCIPESEALTDTLLLANMCLLFGAGIETSAIALSCCLYELALHTDIQDKVRKEIKKVTESSELNYEIVCNDLPYLDMVISETLRKYPPTTITPRVCNQDYTLPGTSVVIKEGTRIMIPIYSLHNDSKYYENPEKFIPERFADMDSVSKPYLPFGDGPRICAGKKLAKDEIKYCLARILSKFSFAPTSRTEIPLRMEERAIFYSPKNGIMLSIQKIVE